MRKALPLLLAACGLAECTVGPNYRRPEVATPAAFSEAQATPGSSITAADVDLSAWWGQFNDPTLTRLVNAALAGNLDRRAAISRVRAARLQVIEARAAEYPSLSATSDALTLNSNRKSSQPAGGAAGGGRPGGGGGLPIPSHLNLYSVGFDATWELDLFGGARRRLEGAKAAAEAEQWARRDGEVSLTAEVASDYFALRRDQARIALGQDELTRQRALLTLVQARRSSGFVTGLDVNQQTGQVATAAAQLPALEADAKVQVHALGVLLGEPPEQLDPLLASAGAMPPPPPALPVGLPSELLRRRPDIREAERRLAAADAGIGQAEADRYPKINLIGLASLASTSLGNLLSASNFSSAVLATLSQPLFDAGRRKAAADTAREETIQADLVYRGKVLGALKDTEDALARYRAEETRRVSLEQAVSAAQNSRTIAEDQYRTGLASFINVLQAETALLNARDQLAQAEAAGLTDLVAVYKAVGGGWSERAPGER